MAVQCSFEIDGVVLVCEVSRGDGEMGAKWATVAHDRLLWTTALAGRLSSQVASLPGDLSKEVSVCLYGTSGWVKVTLRGGNGPSTFCKSWRVAQSSDMRAVEGAIRAFALSRATLTEQLALPF